MRGLRAVLERSRSLTEPTGNSSKGSASSARGRVLVLGVGQLGAMDVVTLSCQGAGTRVGLRGGAVRLWQLLNLKLALRKVAMCDVAEAHGSLA